MSSNIALQEHDINDFEFEPEVLQYSEPGSDTLQRNIDRLTFSHDKFMQNNEEYKYFLYKERLAIKNRGWWNLVMELLFKDSH